MSPHLALTVLLSFAPFWGHGETHRERSQIGAWTLRVESDQFAARQICQLSRPRVDYHRQALVFHLSSRADTANAVYRIDDGPPRAVRSDAMDLARLGFALYNDDLTNPSGGLVRIPRQRIMDAREVSIQAKAMAAPVKFRIDGFGAALDAARAAGCGVDDFDGA